MAERIIEVENHADKPWSGGLRLEREVRVLQEDMTTVKGDVRILKEDVTTLKKDVGVLKEDVTTLKKDVGVLKEDVTTLKADVVVLKEDVKTLKGDVKVLKEDVATLKLDMAVVKSNYATKEDIYETKQDILRLEGKFDIKFEGLRTELHRSLAAQTRWFAASQLGLLVLGLGAAKLIF